MADEIPALIESPKAQPPTPGFWQEHKLQLGIAGGVLAIVIVLGLILYGLTRNSTITGMIRDIAIIFTAFVSTVIGIMLVVLVYQLAMLTQLLRDEIKPLLESAQETMNTLRGTTVFMSDNLVEPTIKASSTVAGARRMVEVLLGLRPGSKSKS